MTKVKVKIPPWMSIHILLIFTGIPVVLFIQAYVNNAIISGIFLVLWVFSGILSFVGKWIADLWKPMLGFFVLVMIVSLLFLFVCSIVIGQYEELEKTGVLLEIGEPGSTIDLYFDDGTYVTIQTSVTKTKARLLPYLNQNITIYYSGSIWNSLDKIVLNEEVDNEY